MKHTSLWTAGAIAPVFVSGAKLRGARSIAWLLLAGLVQPGFADDAVKGESGVATAVPQAAATETAPNFTLPNPQSGMTRVKWPREKAVFLTFGEQASQVPIQAWSKRIKETYTDRMEYVGIAWLEFVPAELHPAAEAVIKASHPDVLMDKSGSCAQRFQCRKGLVNAFVIAPDGTILKRIHEPMTEESFAEVTKLLEPFTKT